MVAQRNTAPGEKPVWDAFFAYAVGKALKQFERMGARFGEDQLIPPPVEAAILAVGRVAPAVVALDAQVAIQHRVSLTLSMDHRVANGRYAAGFLKRVVAELEMIGGDRL